MVGAVGIIVAVAIGAALFVLPVKTWLAQNDKIDALRKQADATESVNGDLQQEVNELQSDEGIHAAAREQLGYQQTNERRETVVGLPESRTCPTGGRTGR